MPKDRLLFTKGGRAKYISHLDLMRTFQRAFVRADIPIKHTEGFNPHPFISIALPLSLGHSSQWELLEFGLLPGTAHEEVPARLNAALPEGVRVERCYPAERPLKELTWIEHTIGLEYAGDPTEFISAWDALLCREHWVIQKPSKKAKTGFVTLDIIPLVKEYSFQPMDHAGATLHVTLSAQNPGLNPSVLVNAFTEEYPQLAPTFVNYCRMRALDGDLAEFT